MELCILGKVVWLGIVRGGGGDAGGDESLSMNTRVMMCAHRHVMENYYTYNWSTQLPQVLCISRRIPDAYERWVMRSY